MSTKVVTSVSANNGLMVGGTAIQAVADGNVLIRSGGSLVFRNLTAADVSGAVSYTDEQAQDATAAMIAAGTHTNFTATYNDAANTMSFAVPLFTSIIQGVVPASGGGTANFLRADGTWAAPPGGGGGFITAITDTATIDLTVASGNLSADIVSTNVGIYYRKVAGGWGNFGPSAAGINKFLYNAGGDPAWMSGVGVTAELAPFSSTVQGVAPASGGGTANFLRADGTWAAPPAGGGFITAITDTATIDLTVASGNLSADVQPFSISIAKMAPLGQPGVIGQVLSTGNIGTVTPLGLAQLTALFTPTQPGTVPASGGGTANYLRADGTWVPIGGGGAVANIQVFSNSGTFSWNRPAGCTVGLAIIIGAGAGGGAGRLGASATGRTGGGGGAGGCFIESYFKVAAANATETVIVGAAGVGAPAVSVSNTNGTAGTNGGDSSMTLGTMILKASGGLGGAGGSGATSLGGDNTGGSGIYLGGNGGNGGGAASITNGSPSNVKSAGGGGGASGLSGSNTTNVGGDGGRNSLGDPAAAGGPGTGSFGGNGKPSAEGFYIGGGGGGGGCCSSNNVSINAGGGGSGGIYGGGGGGGGGALNGNSSGAGGNGAGGVVVIMCW